MNDNSRSEHSEAGVAEVIRRYLEAHDRRDYDVALSAFTPDATVVDDGHEELGGLHSTRKL